MDNNKTILDREKDTDGIHLTGSEFAELAEEPFTIDYAKIKDARTTGQEFSDIAKIYTEIAEIDHNESIDPYDEWNYQEEQYKRMNQFPRQDTVTEICQKMTDTTIPLSKEEKKQLLKAEQRIQMWDGERNDHYQTYRNGGWETNPYQLDYGGTAGHNARLKAIWNRSKENEKTKPTIVATNITLKKVEKKQKFNMSIKRHKTDKSKVQGR